MGLRAHDAGFGGCDLCESAICNSGGAKMKILADEALDYDSLH